MGLALDAAFRARLSQRMDQPHLTPRVPLSWQGARIGSVEAQFFPRLALPPTLVAEDAQGWQVQGELTRSLDAIAHAMREAGAAHVWRDEQLAVTDASGRVLGSVERAAVRPLGITTFAVHMAGFSPEGHHWVQQRSLAKANDPGLWDTLMGGMIPASESVESALERETMEEAGLALSQLRDVAAGYIVEWIDWYTCVVPELVTPRNLDGEVERFALLDEAEVSRMLAGDEFTLEAAVVLSESAS